jgi:hypothetical protein
MYHIPRSIAYIHNPTGSNTTGLSPVSRLAVLLFHFSTFTFPGDIPPNIILKNMEALRSVYAQHISA